MPDFSRAEVSTSTQDLSEYRSFLKKLTQGQVVTLPLGEGESTRGVMRCLNAAAGEVGMRLSRLASPDHAVRFKVASPEKRLVTRAAQSGGAVASAPVTPAAPAPMAPAGGRRGRPRKNPA